MEKETQELTLGIVFVVIVASLIYLAPLPESPTNTINLGSSHSAEATVPQNGVGVVLPAVWGDLGTRLVETGAIDEAKFSALYKNHGQFTDEYRKLLVGNNNGKLTVNEENSGYLLNLLWALGLANKNPILEDKTEMMNPSYGGAGNFASTGGWTVAKGNAMNHYGKHALIELTPEQQQLVDSVSRGIFRPCCGNSAHFPDCNHGMAMLGLLELMASQGVGEKEMYKTALAVNSYWFPDTYQTIEAYMRSKGILWKDVSPKEMLSTNYSSNAGYARIESLVQNPPASSGSGGCGVDSGARVAPRQKSGCGI